MNISKVHETSSDIQLDMYGYKFTVPKGTRLTHMTAMGEDPNYNFVSDLSWIGEDIRGLTHDAVHYGINIPLEYVAEYTKMEILLGHQELIFKENRGYVGGSTLTVGAVVEYLNRRVEITKVLGYERKYYRYVGKEISQLN